MTLLRRVLAVAGLLVVSAAGTARRARSAVLILAAFTAATAGVYTLTGLGWALICGAVLAVVYDYLLGQ